MSEYERNNINSDLIFICWYLQLPKKYMPKFAFKYGANFIVERFDFDKDFKRISRFELLMSLRCLLRNGVIEELHIEKMFFNDENETLSLVETYHHYTEDIKEIYDISDSLGPTLMDYNNYSWLYYFKINYNKAHSFINSYLNKWVENQLFSSEKNCYLAEKQIEMVITHIKRLLIDFPRQKLLVNDLCDLYIDFFTVLLYLEKSGLVSLLNFKYFNINGGMQLLVRIDVLDKFIEYCEKQNDFVRNNDYGAIFKQKNDILLDKNIGLRFIHSPNGRKAFLLLHGNDGETYQKKVLLKGKEGNLIEILYKKRNIDEQNISSSYSQLASSLGFANNRSISNMKSRIKSLCNREGVKQIFHDADNSSFRLNPNLDCCSSLRSSMN